MNDNTLHSVDNFIYLYDMRKELPYQDIKEKFWRDIIKEFVKRRHQLKIPQLEMDDIIGVAKGLVGKWECGMRKPGVFMLYCWAEALKCKLVLKPIDIKQLKQEEKKNETNN
ncbi:putative DNA-binding protein [uncultured Mediterranean phage uvDeep-CGR2-KM21-C368]|nr:putative DNA-binding protein [uncultured Mediterranean phage uvDeep-CGR2-KM21-C368]